MDWSGEGYILSVKKHGETSAIIDVFTREKGRHLGLVRGGVSRKLRPILQTGNQVRLEWRARLAEHLGYYTVESLNCRAAELMNNRLSLAGLNAVTSVAQEVLPERETHLALYDVFEILIDNLHDADIWPALYIQWEMGLLASLGYGLDLTQCAATGTVENLNYVSPRSGRAVSEEAAQPYLDKLYKLPRFMHSSNIDNSTSITPEDIENGLKLTGYFLETRVQWGVNKTLPEARSRMVKMLSARQT